MGPINMFKEITMKIEKGQTIKYVYLDLMSYLSSLEAIILLHVQDHN